MLKFAAIDIGSNSCRLKIAMLQQHHLKTLHEDREVTRLGESVFETGVISPEAMASTIRALKRFHKATQLHVVDQVRVVATSATRDARNSDAFAAWVKSATGWNLEIISGLEEGRLIHLGVVTFERAARGRCLLVDLGGGSCEITLSEAGRIREMVSTRLGAVRLHQEFLHSDPPAKADLLRLKQYIHRELARATRRIGHIRIATVIATSGTAAALAEACTVINQKPSLRKKVTRENSTLVADTQTVRRLSDKLAKLTNAERLQVPGIGPRRSEIIIGGSQVYAALLEALHLKGFRYSRLGLSDGILAQMLAQADVRAGVHKQIEAERWTGIRELCKRYGIDPRKNEPIREHAAQLFDALQRIHELPPDFRFYLEAAALMNDVGKFMNHQGHHRHTQYIIANSELYGFSPEQRAIVSAIARFLGKSQPNPMDRAMRSVPAEEHTHVQHAIILLRLAIALNQNHASSKLALTIHVYPKRILLQLAKGRGGADLETWSLQKEANYFREVFNRELTVEVV